MKLLLTSAGIKNTSIHDALVAQPSDAPRPFSFNHGPPFKLEAEFAKELDGRFDVLDDDADVVQPLKCHAPNLDNNPEVRRHSGWSAC